MAPVRRAPYKDFLQPSLHRRFSSTATILLGIAFVQSIFLASWESRKLPGLPSPTRRALLLSLLLSGSPICSILGDISHWAYWHSSLVHLPLRPRRPRPPHRAVPRWSSSIELRPTYLYQICIESTDFRGYCFLHLLVMAFQSGVSMVFFG